MQRPAGRLVPDRRSHLGELTPTMASNAVDRNSASRCPSKSICPSASSRTWSSNWSAIPMRGSGCLWKWARRVWCLSRGAGTHGGIQFWPLEEHPARDRDGLSISDSDLTQIGLIRIAGKGASGTTKRGWTGLVRRNHCLGKIVQ
jgi:hypothetical protein